MGIAEDALLTSLAQSTSPNSSLTDACLSIPAIASMTGLGPTMSANCSTADQLCGVLARMVRKYISGVILSRIRQGHTQWLLVNNEGTLQRRIHDGESVQ
jgi:hypothetical protein